MEAGTPFGVQLHSVSLERGVLSGYQGFHRCLTTGLSTVAVEIIQTRRPPKRESAEGNALGQMSAKINCPRKHQPRLCQLSVPRMGLIVVWCTNNGWRRKSTCPDNTIPHFIYSAQAGLELDPSFKASQLSPEHKNHRCCSGLFTQPGLGQIRDLVARSVRRMMRQSLMGAQLQSTVSRIS